MKKLKKTFLIAVLAVFSLTCFAQRKKDEQYYVERYQSPYDAKNNVSLLYSKDKDFKEGIEKGFIDVNYRYENGLYNKIIVKSY